jgi:hypothetical protein
MKKLRLASESAGDYRWLPTIIPVRTAGIRLPPSLYCRTLIPSEHDLCDNRALSRKLGDRDENQSIDSVIPVGPLCFSTPVPGSS